MDKHPPFPMITPVTPGAQMTPEWQREYEAAVRKINELVEVVNDLESRVTTLETP